MAKISESTMTRNKERIMHTLRVHPNGLSTNELLELLNYGEIRTLNKHLEMLRDECLVYKEGSLHFAYPLRQPRRLEATPQEAVILYLASRLFVKQSDKRNEIAENTLLKMAEILSEDIMVGSHIAEAAYGLAHRPRDNQYEDVFSTVLQAYIYRRRVEITYHPYRGKPFQTMFEPYLLEPSAIGFSTYAIGYSHIVNKLRTYKLERIEQATILNHEEFTVPEDFPGLELLNNAWSIFYGDETQSVILRFHPEVKRRVLETNWHPSQQIADDDDNPDYLLMHIAVADTTDLKPWIRGWGSHCEVIEPENLRQEMMGEARRLAELYGWYTSRSSDKDSQGPDHSRFDSIFGDS